MKTRLLVRAGLLLSLALTNSPISMAQSIPAHNGVVPISAYQDDPFVRTSDIQQLNPALCLRDLNGQLKLMGTPVRILDEPKIYRQDTQTQRMTAFAWNPWPLPVANQNGDFSFPNESRFSFHKVERGADGKPILKDGLQVWTLNDLHLGMNTAFMGALATKESGEAWAGRYLSWGENGVLEINTHSFIGFNAFYSPITVSVFMGVVPYRLPGESDIKMFEVASSWELAAHEAGHALHATLKFNRDFSDVGYRTWSESFGDQTAMWASLQNPLRRQRLLAETQGNLNQSNALTRIAEAFAALLGEGTGVRDAFHDKKVSDTGNEIHDRSEVLTGASYKIFLKIYDDLKFWMEEDAALEQAGDIMGILLTHATDYTPENSVTLKDVAFAYLKIDKEFFSGRYHDVFVDEFVRREIFDANSEHQWAAREDSLPYLYLSPQMPEHDAAEFLRANANLLGIGQDFELKLQSVVRDERFNQTIVRAQLMLGHGDAAIPFDNHAVLVFRPDGLLADYHAPLQPYTSLYPGLTRPQMQARETTQLRNVISQAKRIGLDQHGAPLAIVRKANGQLTAESRVMRGEGVNAYLEAFSLEYPHGQRREIIIPPVSPSQQTQIPDDIFN